MNADRLLALYEQVAEAPDAVPRLRRFVLDLAVRGKLVPQEAGDEPASELLKRIAAEKARLVKTGEIKVRKLNARERDEPLDFLLPTGWALTELGDLSLKITDGAHKTPTYVEKGVPFVSVKDFSGGKLSLANTRLIPEGEHKVLYQRCDPRRGDILLGRIGTLGKAVLVDTDVEFSLFVSVGLIRFDHENLLPEFFRLVLNSPFVEQEFDRIKIGGGTHTNKLNLGDLHTVALPLPPLAEQRRIVGKVDELIALLDRLEAARTAREATRDRLTAASLARLTPPEADAPEAEAGKVDTGFPSGSATNKDLFPANARFALATLPALTTRPDQIKPLRQTILNLAVRGKLVEQDPTDEPAAAELAKVVKLKADHDLRKAKKVAAIADDEKWCLTPSGWCWTRWDQITNWITYGFTRPMEHVERGVPIVTGKNVNEGQIIFETASLTPQGLFDALNEKDKPQPGDILITKDGSIGRTAIVEERHLPFCINQSVAVMWLRSCHFERRFLKLVLDSPQTQDALQEKTAGVAIKHISITDLGKMVFPLPPVAEQHRIVAKVDALMALCDRLEAALTTTDTTRARLLEALLHEALESAANEITEAAE